VLRALERVDLCRGKQKRYAAASRDHREAAFSGVVGKELVAARTRNMNQSARRWKTALRFAACVLVLWALAGVVGPALAQDGAPGGEVNAVVDKPHFVWQVLSNLFNSEGLMRTLGQPEYTVAAFLALNIIVFVETGLLVGFCLPGDSLLVTAGLVAANPNCGWNVPWLLVSLCLSAIAGDTIGYWIGYKTGPAIFSREKSFFFNKDHLLKAQQFYEQHGGITIVLARFMPILRTFAPVVAGVGRMEYRRFLFFNIFGGVGWVVSMVLAGYFLPSAANPVLQRLFDRPDFRIEQHVEKVVIVVVLVSIAPGIIAWLRSRMSPKVTRQPELVEAK
jgi:membrane-associated protein